MHTRVSFLLCGIVLCGCSLLVDNSLQSRSRMDASLETSSARCGDGRFDPASEGCDDGNAVNDDGCGNLCVPSCNSADDCADQNVCNGNESCGAADALGARRCIAGSNATDGTSCTLATLTSMCRGGVCGNCGNGSMNAGEQCDDGNATNADGCDNDCTFSCEVDADCGNSDVCDGVEVCMVASHTCSEGIPLTCDDEDPCSIDSCSPAAGCSYDTTTNDVDGDGHYSAVGCPQSGDDCDDARADRYPGASESCEDPVDKNCDGRPGTMSTPTWYVDCDSDGYAASTTGSVSQCRGPDAPGACSNGQWVTRAPSSLATTDCQDLLVGVNPGITEYNATPYIRTGGGTSYDYNCDGVVSRQYTQLFYSANSGHTATCTRDGRSCTGEGWWVHTSLPACGTSYQRSYCTPGLATTCARRTSTVTAIGCR